MRCSLRHDNMIVASVCIKQCISLDFHPCMYNTHGINTTSSTIAIMHMHIRTQRERERREREEGEREEGERVVTWTLLPSLLSSNLLFLCFSFLQSRPSLSSAYLRRLIPKETEIKIVLHFGKSRENLNQNWHTIVKDLLAFHCLLTVDRFSVTLTSQNDLTSNMAMLHVQGKISKQTSNFTRL